jgi:hypothetical protein
VRQAPALVANDLLDSLEPSPSGWTGHAASTIPDFSAEPVPKFKYTDPTKNDRFRLEKHGIERGALGGIAMMGIAVVWFVVGLMCNYIFFYPPILFLIGLYAFVKGLLTGNIGGKGKGGGNRRR